MECEQFLRAKGETSKATRKTWNNYRNVLHAFFGWCTEADVSTNRPFRFENPVESVRKFTARQVREEQEPKPASTAPDDVLRIFRGLGPRRGSRARRLRQARRDSPRHLTGQSS